MTHVQGHMHSDLDSSDAPPSPYKRQKLDMASSNVKTGRLSAEAVNAYRSNGAHIVYDRSEASSEEHAKEAACGITEFVSTDLLSFSGILKKRYTDFLVNEILPSGEVVHLTDLKAPKYEQKHNQRSSTGIAACSVTNTGNHNNLLDERPATVNCGEMKNTNGPSSPLIISEDSRSHAEQSDQFVKQQANVIATEASPPLGIGINNHSSVRLDAAQTALEPTLPMASSDPDHTERIFPHKRIPPPPSVPSSMQDLDGKPLEKPTRKKQKVMIRQTDEGWIEVDQEKEHELKEKKAAENAAAGIKAEEPPQKEAINAKQPEDVRYEPKASTQGQWQAFAVEESAANARTAFKIDAEDKKVLLTHFGPQVVDSILALYDRIISSPHRKARDYGTVKSGPIDRETRSKLHQDIRRIFNSRLESVTDNNGSMIVSALPEKPTFHARTPLTNARDRGKKPNQGNKPSWKDLGGDYLHFSLYKENKDTMEAISWLSKELKMKPGNFQFAGTKDRRAVTVQRISVYRVLMDRMIGAGRTLKNAKIGNFAYRPHALQLGELSGNEFVVTLRDCDFHYPVPVDSKTTVDGARSIIGAAIRNLSERGFINYYGLQRFGTFSKSTNEVGVRLLQGDFKGAVDAILYFTPASLTAAQDPMSRTEMISNDDQARAHALHTFKTTGSANLHSLPRKFSAEASLIRHLSKRGQNNDYLGALQNIQRNLRLMYVHAYQSLVWNMAASERWKRFGSCVVEGDLVLIDEHTAKTEPSTKTEDVDEDGEAIIQPSAEDRAVDPEDMFTRARTLSKDEAESGKYNIFDVVLPTPGYDILYPANEVEGFYKEFMGSERGGGLDPHDMRRKWKDISLSGSYRKVITRPGEDISFDLRVYKDEDEQFVETDLDRLYKVTDGKSSGRRNNDLILNPTVVDIDEKPTETGNNVILSPKSEASDMGLGGVSLSRPLHKDFRIAAILKFQLGTSQYATMALRELMKLGGVKSHKPDYGGGR